MKTGANYRYNRACLIDITSLYIHHDVSDSLESRQFYQVLDRNKAYYSGSNLSKTNDCKYQFMTIVEKLLKGNE